MEETKRKPVIQFESFGFQYFSQAEPTLHDINLTIYEGEKVLIAVSYTHLRPRRESLRPRSMPT